MAIYGNGADYDVTLRVSTYMKTSTTQYLVVGMQPETTTADFTAYLANNAQTLDDTMTARGAIGINQTKLSSGSEYCQVRLIGLSKAVCAESISAGSFVRAYEGISTTTRCGQIIAVNNDTCGAYGMTLTTHCTILGRAMESGSTNTVITVFVNPQMYDVQLITA